MKSSANSVSDLEALLREIGAAHESASLPPVHLWQPARQADIGLEIRADGSWWHEGAEIRREKLVRLFSTILRKDPDGFYLVTPQEKVLVHVEDAPFIAVRMDVAGTPGRDQALVFTTNVGDVTTAGPERPLRVETDRETLTPAPYVTVRDELEAKLARPVFYELADLAEPGPEDGSGRLGVWSEGVFFEIGPAGDADS